MEFRHMPRQAYLPRRTVDCLVGRLPVKARMRPFGVVKAEIAADRGASLGDRVVGSEVAIDHRFALSRPALPSAPDKKSFSSVSSPILACSDFKSTVGVAVSARASDPNT